MGDRFDEALARLTQTVEASAALLVADPVDDRLARFVEQALPCRSLPVAVSRADIRRLQRQITLVNTETPEDPLDPDDNIDLGIVLMGCALRGLDGSDADAGVWSEYDGHALPLPRPHREPWSHRLRFAWRAAVTTWRAS